MPSRGTKRRIAEGFAARAVLNSMATGASEAAVKGEATPKGKAKAKGKARGRGPKAKDKKAQGSEKGSAGGLLRVAEYIIYNILFL